MFWASIIAGLKVLTFWEVYVAALIFTVISVAPMVIFGLIGQKKEAVGCIGGMLIVPVFQALATIIFIFTLCPILLGFAEDAAWSFPWKILFSNPWSMIKASFIIIIATIALALIPLLGQIQSLHTFASGAISLIMVLDILHSADPNIPIQKISIMPDFLTIIGFLFIAGVISWASTMLVTVIATALGDRAEDYTALIAIPLGGVLGFIPVFIYGAYIGHQLIRTM
ncbi:MAG: hypothetical protein RBR35_18080 [Salinivirgaceae bacterium]|nr:hypothetical protein [Salinivirgaceae bacterium]